MHEAIRFLRCCVARARGGMRSDSSGRRWRRRLRRLLGDTAEPRPRDVVQPVQRRARRGRARPPVPVFANHPRRVRRVRLRHNLRIGVRRRHAGQLPRCLGRQSPARVQDLPRLGHGLRRGLDGVPHRRGDRDPTRHFIQREQRGRMQLRRRAPALPWRRLVLHARRLRRAWQRVLRLGPILRSVLRSRKRVRRPGELPDDQGSAGSLRR